IHTRYGLDVAINASNLLYFLPSTLYGEHPDLSDAQRLAFYQLNMKTFIRGHTGQAQDIWWAKNLKQTLAAEGKCDHLAEQILDMYELKTASAAIAAAEACCILADTDKKTRAACTAFAKAFGVGFQITNDLLSFMPAQKKDGRAGEDLAGGKLTYVIMKSMDNLGDDDSERLAAILCSPKLRKKAAVIREGIELVRKSGAPGQCQKEAEAMTDAGWKMFSRVVPPSEPRMMLRLFTKGLVSLTDTRQE
ncbi:MAG: polyprenyl synthetase family protein, partial [Methanoregula sp.]|nr:polyprenyl synthetase family protein [Methanoregula sp.]